MFSLFEGLHLNIAMTVQERDKMYFLLKIELLHLSIIECLRAFILLKFYQDQGYPNRGRGEVMPLKCVQYFKQIGYAAGT